MQRPVLDEVIELAHYHSGIRTIGPATALDQDLRIAGEDVTEFVEALAKRFGPDVWSWPWQRFAELSEPGFLVFPYLIWRLLTWPFRRRVFDPSPFERLEMHHIATAIEAGHWIEP